LAVCERRVHVCPTSNELGGLPLATYDSAINFTGLESVTNLDCPSACH
jgi:hypothetical protein